MIMSILSRHQYVNQQLRKNADPKDRKGLNMRFLGYDTDAVARHWGALDDRALQSERRFLELDLIFPTFYGAALSFALWRAWNAASVNYSPLWIIVLVAITMIGDWIENLIHLSQLRLYVENGKGSLQPGFIQVASAATSIKLFFFMGALVLIVILTWYKVVQKDKVISVSGP